MNLGKLGKVETAQAYLDIAFHHAQKHSAESMKTIAGNSFQRLQRKELTAISDVRNSIFKHFSLILTSFPSIRQLDPFYRELVACVVDVAQLRQSLGGINWGVQRIETLFREFNHKIRSSRDET